MHSEQIVNTQKARSRLEERRAELMDRQERVARHTRHRDEPLSQDFAEQAVELENGETLVALDKEISQELVQIDHALKRIDADTYLACEECGEPIGEERLEALPYASRCIDCASEL
jgi:DnaK suppressor protein